MRNEKIWHTCDRCGKNITGFEIKKHTHFTLTAPLKITEVEPIGYVSDETMKKLVDEKQMTVEIIGATKCKEIELCSDCRKAFEKFMRRDKHE